MTKNWLIRNPRIIDGTGAPWFRGDVQVIDGRIAHVGANLKAEANATIVDAQDRYLAPGFIDAHCHDDLICLRDPDRPEKALQGVTTVVVGNCSFSLYPARGQSREDLRKHFSGLLGQTAPEEIFDDFADYRERLHQGVAINVVSLVGHAALRLAVMGYERRAATADEIAAMEALLDKQLAQGAIGLSLGLVYPPSAFASLDEMVALARVVKAHGRLMTAHVRSYEDGLIPSIEEFIEILRQSNAAGLLSHLQSAGRPNWGQIPRAIEVLETARQEGIDISFDMYPYPAGSTYLLQLLPPASLEGGLDQLKKRLRDPEIGPVLRRWVENGGPAFHGQSKLSLIGWENVRISGVNNPALKTLEGLDMRQAAERERIEPYDLLIRLVEEDEGQTGVILFQLDENDLHAACCHRLHMVGSDGLPRPGTKPHPRAFGTFPRIVGPLRRDKGWFSIEDAVRRMTSIAAQRFSLQDRGLVRPDMMADLVLFEEGVTDRATFDESTLLPSGITYVWVNGEAIVRDGAPTGARPGRMLPLFE
ncbi:D-aminoacylase [Microvirga sp. ACRRW]|uniref:N-acyl-D-amino-acid deacylase family protein n=1 Tax=Microvirga sp. ACRRW TaxID=2918205 RepID=UPI001EF6753C|nr:D-aminoacylase [Microvirga sp. ACRRW]MCG7394169.1 D-aminoacylase [Microvirga sp. ACRRW]